MNVHTHTIKLNVLCLLGAFFQISYAAVMREMSDEKLMQRYAKGDAKAFDQLYARHRAPLYRYFIRQVNDPATANDLYQGAWEKIIKARAKIPSGLPSRCGCIASLITTWLTITGACAPMIPWNPTLCQTCNLILSQELLLKVNKRNYCVPVSRALPMEQTQYLATAT